ARPCARCAPARYLHRPAEAVTTTRHRKDHRRPVALCDETPRAMHADAERAFLNVAIGPEPVEQLVFHDDPVPVPDQIGQQIENARLDGNRNSVARKLAAMIIELEPRKTYAH